MVKCSMNKSRFLHAEGVPQVITPCKAIAAARGTVVQLAKTELRRSSTLTMAYVELLRSSEDVRVFAHPELRHLSVACTGLLLVARLRRAGIHTALDHSACVSRRAAKPVRAEGEYGASANPVATATRACVGRGQVYPAPMCGGQRGARPKNK